MPWESRTKIPSGDDSVQVEVLPQIQHDVYWGIKKILEGLYPTGSDVGWVTKSLSKDQVETDRENLAMARAQQTYHTCMDQTSIKKAGLDPLVDFLNIIANIFPVDDYSNKTNPEAFINLQKWEIATFFTPDVTLDEDDTVRHHAQWSV